MTILLRNNHAKKLLWSTSLAQPKGLYRPNNLRVLSTGPNNDLYPTPEGTSLSRQNELKRFPVPKLQSAMSKFVTTAAPFLTSTEMRQTKKLAEEFMSNSGPGQRLQTYLEERAKSMDNWFADWWLDMAYLGWRGTVVVWSSPGIVWPCQKFQRETDQLEYASQIVAGMLDYKMMLDKECIPLETMGKDALDMEQHYQLFGTTRIPNSNKDTISLNPNSKHIVVIHKNNFFKLQVYDGDSSSALPFDSDHIYGSLQYIVEKSRGLGLGPSVGLLTSDSRDNWAEASALLRPDNEATFEAIETSLFTLSLDTASSDKLPDDVTRSAAEAIHGLGPNKNAGNRWFDKTIQVFVSSDGSNGISYEHTTAEAVTLMNTSDHVLHCVNGGIKFGSESSNTANAPLPEHLTFTNVDQVESYITTAHNNLRNLTLDLSLRVLKFKSFGKAFIKKQKISPDSFVQMALQFAFYRLHLTPGGHYESGGIRAFKHGRTDVIRSCSSESVAFAQTMLDEEATLEEKFQAMQNALKGHNNYARMVVAGEGIDRHLTGLKVAAKELGEEQPELFSDPGYTRPVYHRISSSQVSGKSESFVCFGPLVTDGYGACYNIRDYDLIFGLSAMRSCPDTSVDAFHDAMVASLNDMHDLCVLFEQKQQSKL